MPRVFEEDLARLQPSQLYIDAEKLRRVMAEVRAGEPASVRPIPIRALAGCTVMTDGHTRALASHLRGLGRVPVHWDEDDEDWEAYEICVRWCLDAGIRSIADLAHRVVPTASYEVLWLARCRSMHEELQRKREGR